MKTVNVPEWMMWVGLFNSLLLIVLLAKLLV